MPPEDDRRAIRPSLGESATLVRSDEPVTLVRVDGVGPTIAAGADSVPGVVDPTPMSLGPAALEGRYEFQRVLGEGGMGEVRLCHDSRIGRDVAVKVIRPGHGSHSDLRMRFLREARVQGQLEHPSVVPVYDVGIDASGQTFFTMKRLSGSTLEQILDELRQGNLAAEAEHGRRRLLSALSSVCLAVAFAHSRGVVHRDLKPANVMLGEFGEVYVLDWGVARIAGSAELAPSTRTSATDGTGTQAGTLLGTPGFMAPEQARGDIEAIDARTDVYSLGAILFELLTLEPLHRGSSVEALLSSTILGADARASERAPGRVVPPELEAICVRATAARPGDRYASARALHDVLERYLDGERDTERRKELAHRHVLDAQVALALATRSGDEAQRKKALRGLTTALALDPNHEGALHALMQALLEPATQLPPEAEAELKEIERQDRVRGVRAASLAYVLWIVTTAPALFLGVRNAVWPAALGITLVGLIAYTAWMARTGNATPRYFVHSLPVSALAIGLLSCLFGPLVLVPGVAITNAVSAMVAIRANQPTRTALMLLACASVLVPLFLQLTGVVLPFYSIENGAIQILPFAFDFPPVLTWTILVSGTLLTIGTAGVLVGRAVETLKAAERIQFAQAWRLRQLLPEASVRGSAATSPGALAGVA